VAFFKQASMAPVTELSMEQWYVDQDPGDDQQSSCTRKGPGSVSFG